VAKVGVVETPWVLENLAEFVAATAGRPGRIQRLDGGILVASPVPVANGYFNAAFPRDDIDPAPFITQAKTFFAESNSPFILWVPETFIHSRAVAEAESSSTDQESSPQMVITVPPRYSSALTVREVESADDRALFGELCEAGYEIPGLSWILDHHDALGAPSTTWAIACDGDEPLGVGCAYLRGTSGGVFYVATPPSAARRGAATAVTAWLTAKVFSAGATQVTLQASDQGRAVYERLGFREQVALRRFTFDAAH